MLSRSWTEISSSLVRGNYDSNSTGADRHPHRAWQPSHVPGSNHRPCVRNPLVKLPQHHRTPLFPGLTCAIIALLCAPVSTVAAEPPAHQPVFQLDIANPTADKPQSKLWFARSSWWAWLPNRNGSSIWQRTASGWQRVTSLDETLRQLPGRADVLSTGDTIRAVLVDGCQLTVATLRYNAQAGSYLPDGEPTRFKVEGGEPPNKIIETATIACDSQGRCWIAYPWQQKMWVRASNDNTLTEWTEPFAVSEETDRDDLCAIVALPGAVGVAWSNQLQETMSFRLHQDGADTNNWEPTEIIERGNKNADDHISAKVDADGRLLLATKNSVDRVGQPQLVLRIRDPNGNWQSITYAERTTTAHPSRPQILLAEKPPYLLLVHTIYGPKGPPPNETQQNTIAWQAAPLAHLNAATLNVASQSLIDPATSINNVTGCKAMLPNGQPWIVLASDEAGHVYEGQLDATKIFDEFPSQPAQ